jgi:hypothetical protein
LFQRWCQLKDNRRTWSFKKISAEEVLYKNQQPAEPNEKESSIEDAELTAEDVDDLGDFAAAEQQPGRTSNEGGEVSTIELRPKKYRKNFIVTQLRENSGQRNT